MNERPLSDRDYRTLAAFRRRGPRLGLVWPVPGVYAAEVALFPCQAGRGQSIFAPVAAALGAVAAAPAAGAAGVVASIIAGRK